MSRSDLHQSVYQYLEDRNFTVLNSLGHKGNGDLFAVLSPSDEELAVKMVQNENIHAVEDKFWPTLDHPHLIEVSDFMKIEELGVNLYFMPLHPMNLYYTVHEKGFRRDSNALGRAKKWFRQILTAVDYLHCSELCHFNINSDSVAVDGGDNALLCDFSSLQFSSIAQHQICTPEVFRPPECFGSDGFENTRGESFDVWTFGLMSLNVLTGHHFQKKMNAIKKVDPEWAAKIWPIIEETIKEGHFHHLMEMALPNVCLTDSDVHQALHFLRFVLRVRPEERPSASRAMKHPFLKTDANPFYRDLEGFLLEKGKRGNPFVTNGFDSRSVGDFRTPHAIESVQCGETAEAPGLSEDSELRPCVEAESAACGSTPRTAERDSRTSKSSQSPTLGKRVRQWFRKKFSRVFRDKV